MGGLPAEGTESTLLLLPRQLCAWIEFHSLVFGQLQHLWEERQTTNQGTETQTEKVQQILSPHELQTAQAAFKKIDKDKSGLHLWIERI